MDNDHPHYPRQANPTLKAKQNGQRPRRPANDPAIVPNPQINTKGSQESGDALDNVHPILERQNVRMIGRTEVDPSNNYAPQMSGVYGGTEPQQSDIHRGSTTDVTGERLPPAATATIPLRPLNAENQYTPEAPPVAVYDTAGNEVPVQNCPQPSSGGGFISALLIFAGGVFVGSKLSEK